MVGPPFLLGAKNRESGIGGSVPVDPTGFQSCIPFLYQHSQSISIAGNSGDSGTLEFCQGTERG